MQKEKIWNRVLTDLTESLGDKAVSTWLSGLRLKEIENKGLVVETPNGFVKDWVARNYKKEIERSASSITGSPLKLKLETNEELNGQLNKEPLPEEPFIKNARGVPRKEAKPRDLPKNLNPDFNFDSFVVGRSNQFAHAACMAVARKDSKNYNPLFIYGGVGLGKTHLLNAVGNEILKRRPKVRIICIQAETFLNEMIQAIKTEKMDAFRKRYRSDCDVLLMDDIEILAGKERTQEEFFYTFNDLYSAGKKIVMTSDKFPREMTTLEERLRSRFESGIIVDVQPPEYETRLAIIRSKADRDQMNLPDEVAHLLAERIQSNIRALEGCLIRLSAVSSLSGSPITPDLADEVIGSIFDDAGPSLTPDKVMKTVAIYFKIKVSDLKSPKRNRKYAVPRQMAMYVCRELCDMSFPEIGHAFGGRDHSTVIHSVKKIGIEKNTDYELRKHLNNIMRQIKSGT